MRPNARRVAIIYGTRPEAIKVAPVAVALRQQGRNPLIITTGQHTNLLDGIDTSLGLTPDINLDIYKPGAGLDHILASALTGIGDILDSHPDVGAILVHGDTTTTLAGALAGFHHHVPVVHLEAGLRTGNMQSPFPEEANRQLTARIADAHLAATQAAQNNLLREGVSPASIAVIGNTVIDALLEVVHRPIASRISPEVHDLLDSPNALILVTVHRRESWGEPLQRVAQGVADVARDFPNAHIIAPLHPNPKVRDYVTPYWKTHPNIHVIDPQPYDIFSHLLARADVALSDSGGVQEEAPAVNTPLGVLRNNTERQEVIESGQAVLLGTDPERIEGFTSAILTDPHLKEEMTGQSSPYGDGHEVERVIAVLDAVTAGKPFPDVTYMWHGTNRGREVQHILAADGVRVLNYTPLSTPANR